MILSTILGQDTEQTHNLPLSIDLSEVPLDGAWTPVCFDSARFFFYVEKKKSESHPDPSFYQTISETCYRRWKTL